MAKGRWKRTKPVDRRRLSAARISRVDKGAAEKLNEGLPDIALVVGVTLLELYRCRGSSVDNVAGTELFTLAPLSTYSQPNTTDKLPAKPNLISAGRKRFPPASTDELHLKAISIAELLQAVVVVRATSDSKVHCGVADMEAALPPSSTQEALDEGAAHLRRVGIEAEEGRDQMDDRAGRPRLGDVRAEILDREPAGVSGETGEELGQALGSELRAGVEDASCHRGGLLVESVCPKPSGGDPVVVRPHRAELVGEWS